MRRTILTISRKNEWADVPFNDILDIAKNVEKYKLERKEHQTLIKELGFRLKMLKAALDRF